MTDDELLELAALAVGGTGWFSGAVFILKQGADVPCWNPLADDGAALRLAVLMEMDLYVRGGRWAEAFAPMHRACKEPIVGDPYAATRRAIVRAAAEVGREMKESPG